jgi:hypothetical protein
MSSLQGENLLYPIPAVDLQKLLLPFGSIMHQLISQPEEIEIFCPATAIAKLIIIIR